MVVAQNCHLLPRTRPANRQQAKRYLFVVQFEKPVNLLVIEGADKDRSQI